MKVFEVLNKIKGTNSNVETIKSWSIMNHIGPCELEYNLKLDDDIPAINHLEIKMYMRAIKKLSKKICKKCSQNCERCNELFWESEILI